jgi:hypothetical protein
MASPQKRKRKKKAWISSLAARPLAEKGKNGEQMVSFEARKHSKECQKTSTPNFLATPRKTRKPGILRHQKKTTHGKNRLFVINGEVVRSGPDTRKWNAR